MEVWMMEAIQYALDGVLYLSGFLLVLMPPKSIPHWDGSRAGVRLFKHALGLGLFVVGTMGIHKIAREWTGMGFVLVSAFLILMVSGLQVLRQKGFDEEESSDDGFSERK